MLESIFLQHGFSEVTAYELYSDLYHFGEPYVERIGEYVKGKFNPIAQVFEQRDVQNSKNKTKPKSVRVVKFSRIILQDNLEEVLPQLQQYDSSILYPCGFLGGSLKKRRKGKRLEDNDEAINPQIMFGIILEIDEVSDENLENLFSHITINKMYPMPNYMVCSGGGLHLYYVLSEPLRLDTRELKNQMNFLKELLTLNIWNPYTSQRRGNPEIQNIKQGYRIVGSLTKPQYRDERPIVRAFQTHKERYSIEELKEWASSDFDFMYRDRQERLNRKTREECKKLYPKWYQERIVEQRPAGHYTNKNQAFYEKWLKVIKEQANYGHRYKAVKTLAIVALKCGVPYERLHSDVHELVPFLSALKARFPFEPDEADQAMQAYYDKRNYRTKYETLIKLANVKVDYQPYKPKGLSREAGLELARTTLRLKRKTGTFTERGGRKTEETRKVIEYFIEKGLLEIETEEEFNKRLRGKVSEIAQLLSVSRPTVYKAIKLVKYRRDWLDEQESEELFQAHMKQLLKVGDMWEKYLESNGIKLDNISDINTPEIEALISPEVKKELLNIYYSQTLNIWSIFTRPEQKEQVTTRFIGQASAKHE